MKKLRSKFWDQSKDFIGWCCDEELRVLRSMAGDELEKRLNTHLSKFQASEDKRTESKRNSARKRARGL